MKKYLLSILIINLLVLSLPGGLLAQGIDQPKTIEEAESLGMKILTALPSAVKKVWQEEAIPILQRMWDWTKPIIEPWLQKFLNLLGKEVEKRKPALDKELQQEKTEMQKDLWQGFKELFKEETPDFGAGKTRAVVDIMAYLQKGIPEITEISYRTFVKNINQLYSDNGIKVNFNIGKIEWYEPGESCGSNLNGNHLIMCVGPGKGGFLGPPYFIVGANTNAPFGFSATGVMAEAHELAHFLGFQDLYWLRSQEPLKAPIISEVEKDIMTDPYNPAGVFGNHAKYVLNMNLDRLENGKSILYPKNRMAKGLNINTSLPNQNCQIHTRERDYNFFTSKINKTSTLTKITDNSGAFEINIIAGDPADNNFDIYYLACGAKNFWLNSLLTEDCFGNKGVQTICNVKCLKSDNWCQIE